MWTRPGAEIVRLMRVPPVLAAPQSARLRVVVALVDIGPDRAKALAANRKFADLSLCYVRIDAGERAASGELSHAQSASAVRQRQGKQKPSPRTTKQTFFAENGWKVTVTAPKKGTYFEIEEALSIALQEVRLRINSGCQLF